VSENATIRPKDSTCQFLKQNGERCKRSVAEGERFCWQHSRELRAKWRSLTRSQSIMFCIGMCGLVLTIVSLLATLWFGIYTSHPKPVVTNTPINGTDDFVTYVLFDSLNKESPLVCPNVGFSVRSGTCVDLRDFAKGKTQDREEAGHFIATTLQQYLLRLVQRASEGIQPNGFVYGATGPAIAVERIPPIDTPSPEVLPADSILSKIKGADPRFLTPEFVKSVDLTIPKGTIVSFFYLPQWKSGSHGSYVMRFARDGYYAVDLHVTLDIVWQEGSIPVNYHLADPSLQPHTRTYTFLIQLDRTIQRKVDTDFVAEDYDQWAKALFASLRRKLQN
jgi:hypothetical protein